MISNWQIRAVILSVLLTIAAYVGISLYAGWRETVAIFSQIGWLGLAIALALSFLNYLLRFVRWDIYLKYLQHSIKAWPNFLIYVAGFALTTPPAKAGEAIRSYYLTKYQVPVSTSLAVLVSERISDLVAIVLLSCLGVWQYEVARMPILLTLIFIGLFGYLVVRPPQFIQNHPHKIVSKINEIIVCCRRTNNLRNLIITSVISLFSWGAEAVAFYFVLHWLHWDISFNTAVFIYAISMLAGAISFLPGGLGGAEAVMISLLLLKGLDKQSAFAVSIFIRLTTLWFAVLLGFMALFSLMRDKND